MKIALGIFLGAILSLLTNLVSNYLVPHAEKRKKIIVSVFVGVIVLTIAVAILPDQINSNNSSVNLVVNQFPGPSISDTHRADCRINLDIQNLNANNIVVDEITPQVYLGNTLLPQEKGVLDGGNANLSYKVIYWDKREPEDIGKMLGDISLLLSFRSPGITPMGIEEGSTKNMVIDILFNSPTNSLWIFKGRVYPVNNYQEPKLPNRNYVSVSFRLVTRDGGIIKSPLQSCSTIEWVSQ